MKILYVEDNDDNVYMLKNRLSRAAFTVIVATDGAQGFTMARGHRAAALHLRCSRQRCRRERVGAPCRSEISDGLPTVSAAGESRGNAIRVKKNPAVESREHPHAECGRCDYQTYCHVRASTMTATAVNKLNSAQTYSRLWPVLPPCVVMATSFQDTLAVASKHIRLTNKKNNDLDQFVQMDRAPSGHVEISLKRDIVSPTQCFGENRHWNRYRAA
jgi:CheY-like chemotaxis protein